MPNVVEEIEWNPLQGTPFLGIAGDGLRVLVIIPSSAHYFFLAFLGFPVFLFGVDFFLGFPVFFGGKTSSLASWFSWPYLYFLYLSKYQINNPAAVISTHTDQHR